MTTVLPTGRRHLAELRTALDHLEDDCVQLDRWGARLAAVLGGGGRLLACGNGGSAAHAQHLTAELVGRFHDDRQPLAAIALHADTSALTAIVNDYGADEAFARQVVAHGRAGDVLVALSTSGCSANVLAAVERARLLGVHTLALTGALPNPLAAACDEAVAVQSPTATTVQEVHQVCVHLLCAALEQHLAVAVRNLA